MITLTISGDISGCGKNLKFEDLKVRSGMKGPGNTQTVHQEAVSFRMAPHALGPVQKSFPIISLLLKSRSCHRIDPAEDHGQCLGETGFHAPEDHFIISKPRMQLL